MDSMEVKGAMGPQGSGLVLVRGSAPEPGPGAGPVIFIENVPFSFVTIFIFCTLRTRNEYGLSPTNASILLSQITSSESSPISESQP